jgi:predicted DNA-binding helix-hairpin-helix protein
MVTLEKIAQLAQACNFDSIGPLVNVDRNKLDALGAATKYDVCISSWRVELPGVCHSFTHDGRCISMFKTLLTNQCSHQCSYCINATTCSNRPKIFSYTSDELAKLMLSYIGPTISKVSFSVRAQVEIKTLLWRKSSRLHGYCV